MIKKIIKNNIFQSTSLLFISGIILFITLHSYFNKARILVRIIHPQYVADFSDDQVLMGASHNVFIGKVIERVGTKERGIGPETQFSVEVLENIKGDLKDTVTVDQAGGYKDGVLYAVSEEGGSNTKTNKESLYLLQPGSTYLFATRYNEKENWYTLNSYPTASKVLDDGSISDNAQLKTIADNDSRVQALKNAYLNEVPLDADLKSNNALNSYVSVQEKLKGQEESNPEPDKKEDTVSPTKVDETPTDMPDQNTNAPDSAMTPSSPENDTQNPPAEVSNPDPIDSNTVSQ
ncbi:MAG: hypothetical protein V4486_00615 [Patescibacteria group bacterium]